MEPSPGTVDLASLAPPLRALFEGQQATVEALRAELAALTERNRRLEEHGPEVVVEDLHAKVVSLTDRNRNLEHRNRRLEHLVLFPALSRGSTPRFDRIIPSTDFLG